MQMQEAKKKEAIRATPTQSTRARSHNSDVEPSSLHLSNTMPYDAATTYTDTPSGVPTTPDSASPEEKKDSRAAGVADADRHAALVDFQIGDGHLPSSSDKARTEISFHQEDESAPRLTRRAAAAGPQASRSDPSPSAMPCAHGTSPRRRHRDPSSSSSSSSLSSDVTNANVMNSGESSSSSPSTPDSADASLSHSFTSSASDDADGEHGRHSRAGKHHIPRMKGSQETSGASTPMPAVADPLQQTILAPGAPHSERTASHHGGQPNDNKRNSHGRVRTTHRRRGRKDLYRKNVSHVIYGATSAILFVCIVFLVYATCTLIKPYQKSITSAIMLSIVLHPRSRLHSSLHRGTCLQRMERVMGSWVAAPPAGAAAQGSAAASSSLARGLIELLWNPTRHLVAHTMSLVPFSSFVLMQLVFFLGLNKMEWWENAPSSSSEDVQESDLDTEETGSQAEKARGRDLSRARGARHTRESIVRRPEEAGTAVRETEAPGTSGSQREGHVAPVCHLRRRRYVSEAKGRRLLRVLAATLMAVMAHLTLGLRYFVLMHVVLLLLFIIARPLLPLRRFVFLFSMVWRGCLLAFLVVGLAGSVASDVVSVRRAILAKTTEVVTTHSSELLKSMSGATEPLARVERAPSFCGSPPPDALACLYVVPADPERLCVTSPTPLSQAETMPPETSQPPKKVEADTNDQNDLKTFLITKLQQGVLQQLYVFLNKANMTQSAVQFLDYVQGTTTAATATTATTASANTTASTEAGEVSASFSFLGWISNMLKEENERDSSGVNNGSDGGGASSVQQGGEGTAGGESKGATGSYDEYFLLDSKTKHKINERISSAAARQGKHTSTAERSQTSTHDATEPSEAASSIDWVSTSQTVLAKAIPIVELVINLLIRFSHNVLEFFDSLYACTLFFVLFRYLISLDHTVLYYLLAKLLRALEPHHGERHARRIERDITASFITLLQSFWHLAWYHFCCSFISFTVLGLPTPFFFGVVSVLLALFPLMPNACCPPTVAFLYFFYQNVVANHQRLAALFASTVPPRQPLLAFLHPLVHQYSSVTYLVAAAPALLDARAVVLLVAGYLESQDDWLLCVTRGLDGGSFMADTEGLELEQYQPLVVGIALVLGFVAYGSSGIIIGPLVLIVAKVVYDNWDIVWVPQQSRQRQRRERREPPAVRDRNAPGRHKN